MIQSTTSIKDSTKTSSIQSGKVCFNIIMQFCLLYFRRNPNGCPISATFYVSISRWSYRVTIIYYRLAMSGRTMDMSRICTATAMKLPLTLSRTALGSNSQRRNGWRKWQGKGGKIGHSVTTTGHCREILAAYGGVHLEDIRGMRAPFLAIGVIALYSSLVLIIINTINIPFLNFFRATLCSLCFMKQTFPTIHQCQSMKTR